MKIEYPIYKFKLSDDQYQIITEEMTRNFLKEKIRSLDLEEGDEKDFIKYLNTWVFPEQPSVFIENIGQVESDADIPEKYRECPVFHF